MRVSCPGFAVVTGAGGEALCVDALGAPVAWEAQPEFDVSQLEADQLSGAFAAGFVVVATAFVIGYGFRALLRTIGR